MNRSIAGIVSLSAVLSGLFFFSSCFEAKKPKLVIATEATFPPYEYYEADGTTISGIDPDIMRAVAQETKTELVIQSTSFDYILKAVQDGTVDVGASGITITEERKKMVDFSIPYAVTRQVIAVRKDSSIVTPKDLKGKFIGVQRASTGDDFVTKNIQEPIRVANGDIAFSYLANGKLDAVVLDEEPAKVHLCKYLHLRLLNTALIQEEYAFAVRKGRTDLLEKINAVIRRMQENHALERLTMTHISRTLELKNAAPVQEVLRISIEPSFPPYEYMKDNQIVGIDPDIINVIAADLGCKAEFHNMPFDSLPDDIRDGKADIGACSISITEERRRKMDFSIPYHTTAQLVLVSAKSGIRHAKELKGKRIGTIYGTTAEAFSAQHYGESEHYSDAEKMVGDLVDGALDAVIIDSDPAILFLRCYPSLKRLPEELCREQYAFAVRKGRTDLLEKINKVLSRMIADGSIQKIRAKYMDGKQVELHGKK